MSIFRIFVVSALLAAFAAPWIVSSCTAVFPNSPFTELRGPMCRNHALSTAMRFEHAKLTFFALLPLFFIVLILLTSGRRIAIEFEEMVGRLYTQQHTACEKSNPLGAFYFTGGLARKVCPEEGSPER